MREATREAARAMIQYLQVEHGLSREDAYMLCSVAGDLRLHEVVCLIIKLYLQDFFKQSFRLTCRTMWYVCSLC